MNLEFYTYCKSFYGKGEIYDLGVSNGALQSACELVVNRKDIPFEGDTVDREKVRNILEILGFWEVTR